MPRNADCRACGLCDGAATVCLWGEYTPTALTSRPTVMVVGEAPGGSEDHTGRPFVGPSGKLIRQALDDAGIKDYYITNTIKCRPPENKLPDNKKKLTEILSACRPYLEEEIATAKPKFILALGNVPLLALTGHTGITKMRGTPIEVEFPHGKVTVFPAYHPAYVLRNPGLDKMFRVDLGTFANLVKGRTGEDFWEPLVTQFVRDYRDLGDLLIDHGIHKATGFVQTYDVETLADDPDVKAIDCPPEEGTIPWVGIGYMHPDGRNVQYVIPWEHQQFSQEWMDELVPKLKLLLEDKGIKRVGQNGPFDDRWLISRGIVPWRTFDTLNAGYLLDENVPHDLETLATLECGAPSWSQGFDYSRLGDWEYRETVTEYLSKDLFATGKVYFSQREKLIANPKLLRIFARIVMPADRLTTRMYWRGLYVHEEELVGKTAEFDSKRGIALAALNEAYHRALLALDGPVPDYIDLMTPPSVNWNSTKQKQRILFEELGLPIYRRSKKTGDPSTDKDTLARLEDEIGHPVVVALRKYQKIEMLCRFLKRWRVKLDRAKVVRGESRIYTSIGVANTKTGRTSARDPDGTGDNLQQVPSRGEGAELRAIFGAPAGRKFWEADYSQIELVGASLTAPEPTMKRLFREGKDIHYHTGALVARKPVESVTKDERKKAKAVNFGFLFKMMPKKFVKYALTEYGERFTLREAERVREAYYREFPGLLSYYTRIEKEVRSTGQVVSPLGRIRRLPDIFSPEEFVQEEAIRQAVNQPIQSLANDMTLLAAVEIDRLLAERPELDAWVSLLVHDMIGGECPDDERQYEVAKIVKQVMEKWVPSVIGTEFKFPIDVPIRSEFALGSSWGKGKEWKGE